MAVKTVTEEEWNALLAKVQAAETNAQLAAESAAVSSNNATASEKKATEAANKAAVSEQKAADAAKAAGASEKKAADAAGTAGVNAKKADDSAVQAGSNSGGYAMLTPNRALQAWQSKGPLDLSLAPPAPPTSPVTGKALPALPAVTGGLSYPAMSDDSMPGFSLGTVDDEFIWIGRDSSHVTVSDDRMIVGGNQVLHVNVNRDTGVGGVDTLHVVGNAKQDFDKDLAVTVLGKKEETTNGPKDVFSADWVKEIKLGFGYSFSGSGTVSVTVGATITREFSAKASFTTGVSYSSTRGYHKTRSEKNKTDTIVGRYKMTAGTNLILQAETTLQLRCGSSLIILEKEQIILKSKNIAIQGNESVVAVGNEICVGASNGNVTIRASGEVDIPKGVLNDKNLTSK